MAEPYAPLLTRKKILSSAEETTSGTVVAVTAAVTSVAVFNPKLSPQNIFGEGERRPAGNYLGTTDAAPGPRKAKLTWQNEVKPGDGSLALLTAAGFRLNTGVYNPTSDMSLRKTRSYALFEDGRKKIVAGGAGNVKLIVEPGKTLRMDWDVDAVWQSVGDVSLPAQSPLNAMPYICTAITWTIGGAALPHTGSLELDMGNKVEPRMSVAATSGISHFVITDRGPKIVAPVEARTVANFDAYGLLLAGTTAALSIVFTSGANTLTIAIPRAQRIELADEDAGGILLDRHTWCLNASSGDDELTITEA